MKAIHDGLAILLKYTPTGMCSAEHDELHAAGPPRDEMPAEDAAALEALGWRWNESYECWSKFT